MPLYEYEKVGGDCLICGGRFAVLQSADEPPLDFCPTCGLEARKVISKASIVQARQVDYQKAAERGLSTFRKSGKGTWEKIAGPGVDAIVGEPESAKPAPKKPIDLDES